MDKIAPMDLGEQLIETWNINQRLDSYLLNEVGEERLDVALGKSKRIEAHLKMASAARTERDSPSTLHISWPSEPMPKAMASSPDGRRYRLPGV